jgi:hypothetical protein
MFAVVLAEERVRDEMQEHITEESTRRERDHRVQGRRLERGWDRQQDEVRDAELSYCV